MRSSNLDMALARKNAQSGLRTEVDELPSEVALVLRYVLVKGRRQTRIVPCSSLRVVVNEVHSGSVGEAHLPTAGQGSELRNRLLLNGSVVTTSVLSTVHPNVLLPSRVDPCGCSSVVVDKVCPTFGCVSLLPACWKFASTGGSSAGSHHLGSSSLIHRVRCLRRRVTVRGWRVGTCPVFRQYTCLMSLSLHILLLLHLAPLLASIVVGGRSDPGSLP
jgi:hypothetical protein